MFIPFRLVAITFWLFDTLYFYKKPSHEQRVKICVLVYTCKIKRQMLEFNGCFDQVLT